MQEKSTRFGALLVNDMLYHLDEVLRSLGEAAEVRALQASAEWATLDEATQKEKTELLQRVCSGSRRCTLPFPLVQRSTDEYCLIIP